MNSLRHVRLVAASALLLSGSQVLAQETDKEKLSYAIGMNIAQSLQAQGTDVDIDTLLTALKAKYTGGEMAMSDDDARAFLQEYVRQQQEEQVALQAAKAEANKAAGDAFLAENAEREGVMTTDSGLQYKVIEQGSGPMPAATDRVTVHYRGTLIDGTEFDSSIGGEPVTFGLNQVIPGWTEGVQLMPVGSKYEFYINPELGYGAAGGGPIPPNSTLVFEVELIGIE